MSKRNPKFKPNSPYSEAIGRRSDDRLDLFDARSGKDSDVYRYDRDRYSNINEFFSKYDYMCNLYQGFCIKHKYASIKDFLETNATKDKHDVFEEISFKYRNYKIDYSWRETRKEVKILGTFRIQDYFFFPTDQYLFLRHRATGKSYIYCGEVY